MPTPNEATLPIDKSVKMPAAVLRNSAASDRAFHQVYGGDAPPPTDTPAPVASVVPEAPVEVPTPVPAAAPVIPEASSGPGQDSWETRYKALKGQFDRQGQRISGLEGMLATMQTPPAPTPATPTPPELRATSLVTPEEREAYGEDFLDVVARRAREAVQPELDAKEQEIKRLMAQVNGVAGVISHDARSRMMSQLATDVPNWEQLNTDANFLNWLLLPDAFSGVIRQVLLNQAFEQNNTDRVLAFFKSFLREEAVVAPIATPEVPALASKPGMETFAAPGRGKGTSVPVAGTGAKPTITRSEIAAFYADVRAGKYARNEAEKNRLESMIWDAQKEGRIR